MKAMVLLVVSFVSLNAFGFDHSHNKWSEILNSYTLKEGRQVLFNYKTLKKNKDLLNEYLLELESVDKKTFKGFSKDQKLAFWINAYNAYTVKIILDNYPVESIKEISSGWLSLSSGPWKKDFINLLGTKMSLDDIEHDTIRKEFKEPRIHFAVNCASLGCPSLLQEAFKAKSLDAQLDQATLNFLKNKNKNYVKEERLHVSKIFKWYGEDFVVKFGSFQRFIVKYLNLPQKNYEVSFTNYDWNLNETKKSVEK